MKSYLLDTSVIIDVFRKKDHAISLVESLKGELVCSYVCYAELYEGIHRVRNREHRESELVHFFANFSTVYPVEEEISRKFGELRAGLKQKGSIIEDLDLFIAATCIVHDLELVTFNKKHFSRIEGLKIYES